MVPKNTLDTLAPLQELRLNYKPRIPGILEKLTTLTAAPADVPPILSDELTQLFPNLVNEPPLKFVEEPPRSHKPIKIGVVLSGGQAAGGHNVIAGIFDALKLFHRDSRLYGFKNGPGGIVNNNFTELTAEIIDAYRNQGGFDMIGSGRTKIETPEQFEAAAKHLSDFDGLVIIGGDDSNTNAALLAQYFIRRNIKTRVIGVPKTIDGDLKNEWIESSFGFDTACKTYSEFIGNVARDALSQGKYYFFIKMMGRSASHIALECAMQTRPNMTLIGEEIAKENRTVTQITNSICDMIEGRYAAGKEYGVILIPEGTIEFIPECNKLIAELNTLLTTESAEAALAKLSKEARGCYEALPTGIQSQLLIDRDAHGNVQVSKIETERLFIETVTKELKKRQFKGKFSAQPLFCGYEGRSGYPSNFDTHYCYALGHVAALLIDNGATGYMSLVQNLTQPVEQWAIGAAPLVAMMDIELRKGKRKPVIKKALVELNGALFAKFREDRDSWAIQDFYRYPGPIQFWGPPEITDTIPLTLTQK